MSAADRTATSCNLFDLTAGTPTLHEPCQRYTLVVLDKHAGDKKAAARELGISLKTLYTKLHQVEDSTYTPNYRKDFPCP